MHCTRLTVTKQKTIEYAWVIIYSGCGVRLSAPGHSGAGPNSCHNQAYQSIAESRQQSNSVR